MEHRTQENRNEGSQGCGHQNSGDPWTGGDQDSSAGNIERMYHEAGQPIEISDGKLPRIHEVNGDTHHRRPAGNVFRHDRQYRDACDVD